MYLFADLQKGIVKRKMRESRHSYRMVGGNQRDQRWSSFHPKMSTSERAAEFPLNIHSLLRVAFLPVFLSGQVNQLHNLQSSKMSSAAI